MLTQTDLFVSGQDGYHTSRIPAMVVSTRGTMLAFWEGRKYSSSDTGDIDLLLKRSFDGGRTWQETQTIVSEPAMTFGNPCPVVDESTGTIWLPFCSNSADGPQDMIMAGKATRTVWLTCSIDDGATWVESKEISSSVKDAKWTWYGTGPGHGIHLEGDRLLIPCHHAEGENFNRQDPFHPHVIYSDDHGATWRIGGIVEAGTDECAAVETTNGEVYINCRNDLGTNRRAIAWSTDKGGSFSRISWEETLIEPSCQASLVRFTDQKHRDRSRVIFGNPASTRRRNMTVRVSYDECRTWSDGRTLHEGPSGYSDLAVAPDDTICCLYERGDAHPYERLTLARFDIGWMTNGTDPAIGDSSL